MRVSGALRHIEHIATLQLGAHVAIPEMLRALDVVVPSARAGFFWMGEDGAILDAYVPRAHVAHRRPPAIIDPGALLRCDRDGGVQLNVRVGERLRAVLAVRRIAQAAPITERDRRLLRATVPAFTKALAAPASLTARFDEVPDRTAALAAGTDARLVSADADAMQLLDEMDGRPLVDGGATIEPGAPLPAFVADLVRAGAHPADSAPAILQRISRWGAYRARAFPQDGAGVVVTVAKHLPATVRVVRTLEQLDLSPRERQVAFQLGIGADAGEGAAALGVSVATWRSYVKRVYQRLDVRDRLGLFARLNGRAFG